MATCLLLSYIDRVTLVKWVKLESTNRRMDTRMLPNVWPHCYAVDKKNPKRPSLQILGTQKIICQPKEEVPI